MKNSDLSLWQNNEKVGSFWIGYSIVEGCLTLLYSLVAVYFLARTKCSFDRLSLGIVIIFIMAYLCMQLASNKE